jgi:hypothetical protein
LEADILCEAARQAEKMNISEELLLMALSLCPLHPCSLIALADLELKKIELNPIKNDDYRSFINNDNLELNHSETEDFYGVMSNEKKLIGKTFQEKNIVYDDIKAYQYAMTAVKGITYVYIYSCVCLYMYLQMYACI